MSEWDNFQWMNVGERKKTRENIELFFSHAVYVVLIHLHRVSFVFFPTRLKSQTYRVFLYAHNRQKESETKDEDEGENLSKNSPIKTWKWKHKSTRNRFESEILAGIKKKEKREDKHTTLKKIRGAFRARSARFSHHFHSRDSDYVSCQCTERTLFFNYRTLIECDLVIDCSIAAWAREKRGGKNCFSFFLSFHSNSDAASWRESSKHELLVSASAIHRHRLQLIIYCADQRPRDSFTFHTSELKCYNSQQVELARWLESRLWRVSRVWNMENECEKWTIKSTLYARALASLSQLFQAYA